MPSPGARHGTVSVCDGGRWNQHSTRSRGPANRFDAKRGDRMDSSMTRCEIAGLMENVA